LDGLPTKADAERAAEVWRARINTEFGPNFYAVTVRTLAERYMLDHVAKHCRPHTIQVYRSLLDTHILMRWGDVLLRDVRPMALEAWIHSLPSRPIISHVRGLLAAMFRKAQLWELMTTNPIAFIRVSSQRLKEPTRLSVVQVRAVADHLREPIKTMWLFACCTGLRSCEVIAIQWQDVDFENATITVRLSCVQGHLNSPKTRASAATVPLDAVLARLLREHWQRATYRAPDDFIFASDSGRPRWASEIVKSYLRPAGFAAGAGRIGWHTARHSYSTLLRAGKVDPKVHQSLMRHSSIVMTMDGYSSVATDQQRDAASTVASAVLAPACTQAIQ
jgi:integrase